MAARIDALVAEASREMMVRDIMELESITAAELARRVKAKPPQISRDLEGGLRKASLSRVNQIAQALGYDFVPLLIPRNDKKKHEAALKSRQRIVRSKPVPRGAKKHAAA